MSSSHSSSPQRGLLHIWRMCFVTCTVCTQFIINWHDSSTKLVTALVPSHLDHCNAIIAGLPASTLAALQSNAVHVAVQTVLDNDIKPCDLLELHWLPIAKQTKYKLCFLAHKVSEEYSQTCWYWLLTLHILYLTVINQCTFCITTRGWPVIWLIWELLLSK